MKNWRSIAGAARARVKVRLRRGSAIEHRLYHALFGDAYRREKNAVWRGNRHYWQLRQSGKLEFLLRRNIHMLEKGLTMRPRRSTFALAYIEETVTLVGQIIRQDPPVIEMEVENWAREVLSRYFDATKDSPSPEIRRARNHFEKLVWNTPGDANSGPHAPFTTTPPVDYEDLLELAKRRKSVRWFTDTPVPRDVIEKATLVAAEAPSACNRQPFTFRVFDAPEMVKTVADIPMGTAGYGHNIPTLLVIVGDLSAFIDERDRHLIYTDGCLAAMSFILALEAQGVASVCINWPDIASREKRMKELLGLSSHERVVMLIGIGFADASGHTPFSAKRAVSQLLSYNELEGLNP